MASSNIGATSATYNDVTRTNIKALSPDISAQIAKAKFIAIDTEFTGLVLSNASRVFGINTAEWVTRSSDMRDKYKAMANVAKTHALVSMGLSTFSIRHTRPGSYNVNNFNFLLQAQNSHLINPSSMSFLAENGFDLVRQATKGIRYFSGPNPHPVEVKTHAINMEGGLIRNVFLDVVRARVPLIIHNGLFDLVYLYQSFFGPLPDTYDSFAHDLCEMFPGGIYDTKYIAEQLDPEAATYLAYLYHKNERIQKQREQRGEPALSIKLRDPLSYGSSVPKVRFMDFLPENSTTKPYCLQFAQHGHCRLKDKCLGSHDINFILDCQEREAAAVKQALVPEGMDTDETTVEDGAADKKRKRDDASVSENGSALPSKIIKAPVQSSLQQAASASAGNNDAICTDEQTAAETTPSLPLPLLVVNKNLNGQGGSADPLQNMYHTAAYDAFMTGYIFAAFRLELGDKVSDLKNKVYLMGKAGDPLLIKAGPYSKGSVTYRQTMKLLEPDIEKAPATTTAATTATKTAESPG